MAVLGPKPKPLSRTGERNSTPTVAEVKGGCERKIKQSEAFPDANSTHPGIHVESEPFIMML